MKMSCSDSGNLVDISGSDLGNSWALVNNSGFYVGKIEISGSDLGN